MKKTLALIALATTLTTFGAHAETEMESAEAKANSFASIEFKNDASTGRSVWVTIYNVVGRIGDARCVKAGEVTSFGGYMPPFSYEVRAQVQDQADCGGRTIHDESHSIGMNACGINAEMTKDNDGRFHLDLSNC